MASDIKHYFSMSTELSSLAEALAKEAFTIANPGASLVRARLRADEQDRFVVLVQHGAVAEPKYRCYAVSKATREVTELADAVHYVPKR